MNPTEEDIECVEWDRPVWQSEQSLPVVDETAALRRMQRILESLVEENWLPIGLRTLVAEEVSSMRTQLHAMVIEMEKVAERVHAIALATFAYRELLSRSETIAQLRVLDLELSPSRYGRGFLEADFGVWLPHLSG